MQPLLRWEKQCVTFSECVFVAFRHPASNAHAPFCHLLFCPSLPYLSILSRKRHDFHEKSY